MIEANYFNMAKYLILYKIPNDHDYFKDILLFFLAAGDRGLKSSTFSNDVVKMILTPETTSLIRNNLEALIDKYKMAGFISTKTEVSPSPVM